MTGEILLQYGIPIYFVLINLAGFLLCGRDKSCARRNKWRISEKTLFVVSLVGGALGFYIGMKVFHHKTKVPLFAIGVPLVLWAWIVLAVVLAFNWGVDIPVVPFMNGVF